MSKNIQPPTQQFFKVVTDESSDEATILLYGYIGESYTWDTDAGGWKMDGVTDLDFVREFSRLAASYKRIHLRLNSYGGDFRHGNAIMTAIANSIAQVHTWNDGIAASMAADIWLCGAVRHMAKNALLMIHPTWSYAVGNAKEMRECADIMDKMTDAAIIATAASLGMDEEEMRSRYYADYADHWLTYKDAVADALVSSTEEYDAAEVEKSIETMTYKQLVTHFEKNVADAPEAPGMLTRLRKAFELRIEKIAGKTPPAPPSPAQQKDMTLEEFRKSLDDNTLDLAAVKAHIAEIEAAAEPPAPTAEPAPADPLDGVLKELATLKASLAEATKRLDEYAQAPGAAKASPGLPDTDAPISDPVPDSLHTFNEAMATAAKQGATPFRPIQ